MKRAALLLAILPAAAQAQDGAVRMCAPNADMRQTLQVQYRERPAAYGPLTDGTKLVTLWVNPESATWTLTATGANGITCVVAAGKEWTAMPEGEPS